MAPESREDRPETPPSGGVSRTEFERLHDDHYGRLLSYVKRRGVSPSDAGDVVAEAFFSLWKHWRKNGRPEHPESYLQRIVSNEMRNYLLTMARRRDMVSAEPLGELAPQLPEERFEYAAEIQEWVLQALSALPERQREVVALRLEGMTDPEIGAQLRLDPKTVSTHMSRARKALREFLLM